MVHIERDEDDRMALARRTMPKVQTSTKTSAVTSRYYHVFLVGIGIALWTTTTTTTTVLLCAVGVVTAAPMDEKRRPLRLRSTSTSSPIAAAAATTTTTIAAFADPSTGKDSSKVDVDESKDKDEDVDLTSLLKMNRRNDGTYRVREHPLFTDTDTDTDTGTGTGTNSSIPTDNIPTDNIPTDNNNNNDDVNVDVVGNNGTDTDTIDVDVDDSQWLQDNINNNNIYGTKYRWGSLQCRILVIDISTERPEDDEILDTKNQNNEDRLSTYYCQMIDSINDPFTVYELQVQQLSGGQLDDQDEDETNETEEQPLPEEDSNMLLNRRRKGPSSVTAATSLLDGNDNINNDVDGSGMAVQNSTTTTANTNTNNNNKISPSDIALIYDGRARLYLSKARIVHNTIIIHSQSAVTIGDMLLLNDNDNNNDIHNSAQRRHNQQRNRGLGMKTGIGRTLILRVIDASGRQTSKSPTELSDDFFGTGGLGDTIHLASQMASCSGGQLQYTPAIDVVTGRTTLIVGGVMNVQLSVNVTSFGAFDAPTPNLRDLESMIMQTTSTQLGYNPEITCTYILEYTTSMHIIPKKSLKKLYSMNQSSYWINPCSHRTCSFFRHILLPLTIYTHISSSSSSKHSQLIMLAS
jgi:hypothetical protein